MILSILMVGAVKQGMHQMVLDMPSENRKCQGRGNMGGQLIPDLDFEVFEDFEV